MGRPSSYTPELGDEIAMRCVMASLHKVCQADDMPAESTVYRWLIEHDEFSAKYARAREARAYRRAEGMDEIAEEVRTGVIPPDVGRVLIDAIKWQTGKENRRAFGDKVEHEHGGSVTYVIETGVDGGLGED